MHSDEESRLLTERQRQALSLVVENKVYRNRDSRLEDLAADMGIAPTAVVKHLLRIEANALLHVLVIPSERGKRVYERLRLEPTRRQVHVSEALDPTNLALLRFLERSSDATAVEIAEELGASEYATLNRLRVLMAVSMVERKRGPAVRRGVPPFVYRATTYGLRIANRLSESSARQHTILGGT